ncbi:MAG TPA: CHASE3 domain-containing protein, partial [Verrucomicrobiae bacterium]|nr:CHASE3 domain-containing protein [Verrucomicrobiae bacterium]
MQRKRWFLGALLALAIAILALVEWLACWNMLQTQEGDRWVNHTYSVIRNLNGLSNNIKKAEAAQRRFLLTGSEAYLARYRTNLDGIAQQFEDVK